MPSFFFLDYLIDRKDNTTFATDLHFTKKRESQWSSISIYIVSLFKTYTHLTIEFFARYTDQDGFCSSQCIRGLFHTERSLKLCSGKVERRVPWIYGDSRFCYERVVQSCGFSSIVIAEIRDTTFHQSSSFSPCAFVNPLRRSLPKMWNALFHLSFVFSFLQSIFLTLTNLYKITSPSKNKSIQIYDISKKI